MGVYTCRGFVTDLAANVASSAGGRHRQRRCKTVDLALRSRCRAQRIPLEGSASLRVLGRSVEGSGLS